MSTLKPSKLRYIRSSVLDTFSNTVIKSLIGHKRESLATTVVQVYLLPIDGSEWRKECFGVLCYVKDHVSKCYIFEVYCLAKQEKIWAHELYEGMLYTVCKKKFFHQFEGEDGIVGFNFAQEKEAKKFAETVHLKFTNKIAKQAMNERKKKKPKIDKLSIGSPLDFRHNAHVGLDGSFSNECDFSKNDISQILEMAGLNTSAADPLTMKFAEKFIKKKYRKKRRAPQPPTQQQQQQKQPQQQLQQQLQQQQQKLQQQKQQQQKQQQQHQQYQQYQQHQQNQHQQYQQYQQHQPHQQQHQQHPLHQQYRQHQQQQQQQKQQLQQHHRNHQQEHQTQRHSISRTAPLPPPPRSTTAASTKQVNNSMSPRPPPPPPPPMQICNPNSVHINERQTETTNFNRTGDDRSNLFDSIRNAEHKLKPVQDRVVKEAPIEDDTDFKSDIAKALSAALASRNKSLQDSDTSDDAYSDDENFSDWE